MKLLKKSLLLSLVAPLLFSLLSFTNVTAEGKDIVTVRIYERGPKDRIEIYANEKTTDLSIEKGTAFIEAISKTLEKFYQEGYHVETSNAVINSYGAMTTTYILTK